MIALLAIAASTVIPCPQSNVPLVAKNYHPHPIEDARDAVISALSQYKEFAPKAGSQDEWLKSFEANHSGTIWILDRVRNGADLKLVLNEKDGRLLCAWVID